jgi:hypothetical protein
MPQTPQEVPNLYEGETNGFSFAGVAQLVEHQLPKLNVASSNLVSRYAGVAQW